MMQWNLKGAHAAACAAVILALFTPSHSFSRPCTAAALRGAGGDRLARARLSLLVGRAPRRRCGGARMDITVCTGGVCAANGGEQLLLACSILAAGDESVEVKSAMCTGVCPAKFAMISPRKGAIEDYEARCDTVNDAIASATAAIFAADAIIADGLRGAFIAASEAKNAETAGDMSTARHRYAEAIAAAPATLLKPCQMPLNPEPTDWSGSRWTEDAFSSDLVLSTELGRAANDTERADGTCGGGTHLVDRKVVTMPTVTLVSCTADGLALSGRWEDSAGGRGEFELTMSTTGRTYTGTLRSSKEGEKATAWSGVRKSAPAPRAGRGGGRGDMRSQTPPSRVSWVHEALLGKVRCSLALGETAAALEDAKAATELCCRTPSGWVAYADALEASGDDQAAWEVRRELAYLKARP